MISPEQKIMNSLNKQRHVAECHPVKDPTVGDPEGRNHGQRQKREVHERVFDPAHLFSDFVQGMEPVHNFLVRQGGHQPGAVEREDRLIVPAYCDHASLGPYHAADGPVDQCIAGSDRDDVVGIVGDAPGNGPVTEAEAVDKAKAQRGRPVPVADRDLQDIPFEIRNFICGTIVPERFGHDLAGDKSNHPGRAGAGDPERVR